MLGIMILLFLTGTFCGYLLFFHIPHQDKVVKSQRYVIDNQKILLDRIISDNLALAAIARQQANRATELANHISQEQEFFPSLTITHLN